MTTTTQTNQTAAQFREELLIELGSKETAIRTNIDHLSNEIHSLKNQAAKHSEWQDHGAAQQAIQLSGSHHAVIQAARSSLREVELEREGIIRGTDPRVVTAAHAETQNYRHAIHTEYTETLAKFTELTKASSELVETAKKLIDLSISMAFEPPAAALAIVNHV